MNTRRDFLKQAAAFSALAGSASATPFAQFVRSVAGRKPDGPRSIVCIYLRGGADWLNMVVPYEEDEYHEFRPTIAMTEDDGLIDLDGDWGLHPALRGLYPLWQEKMLAPIVAVGSPHPTRSHFDAQDFMEFAAPGNRTVRDGWLNRYLSVSSKKGESEFRAMAAQELLPRSLRGDFPVLAVPNGMANEKGAQTLSRFEEFYGDGAVPGEMGGMEGMEGRDAADRDEIVESGQVTIETLRRYQAILAESKSGADYPNSRFGRRLRDIAKVLKAGEGLEVCGLDYGGWDDHANQGGAEGRFATRLKDLSDCLQSFCMDLGKQMTSTTIVVMTEFGRTVRENGNTGTDHGHGGGMFVLGGGVKGGKIHGDWDGLKPAELYQGRDLQVTTDFRDVFQSLLEGTFDFDAPRDFFPDYRARGLSSLF